MNSITVILQDVTHRQEYADATSFVGEDKTGHFGILPDHARFMTSLAMGLCRFKTLKDGWLYVATAGALLYFHDNRLSLTSRHFLVDSDYQRISVALAEQILAEETRLQGQKLSLRKMEEELLKRLWEFRRRELAYRHNEI
jgi:F-type H+-transporting ATPase subunit epsilon